jgi:nucleoside-diphosphate-sugar epimerase
MSRNICITAAEGNTGFLIAELILTDPTFKKEVGTVTGLALNAEAEKCKDLKQLGANIVQHRFGRVRDTVKTLQETKSDVLCLVPPAHVDKVDITVELIEAAKRANIANVLFLSAAGCDLAERMAQPRLREFIDLESLFMRTHGDPTTMTGHCPVIVR